MITPAKTIKEYAEDLIGMSMTKYYDIHMVITGDCKEGYSVFVAAGSAEEAIREIIENTLYEDISDIDNIDYIGEITEEEYYSSV